ncbi:DUF2953 domain-containing protein [Halalkalibacter nanhaiisediminis]|uniref:DUF2953 family protein n=1 Tax=Halalkalibacter nanhaiisediminis TaxID=688079 RepID=A0A562QL87_9BACI|nr:DUF2953 domain-containing protein [Halalkalibacter nanhaiisediminis]TWI56960.1 Protein of unknown function (DUF2953) [Halalkalibacter nanhaiisediminis]
MGWLIGILIILVVLFVLLMVTKLKIKIDYQHNQDNDLLEVNLSLWGMRVFKFKAPLIKIDEDSASLVVKEEEKIGNKNIKKTETITPQTIIDGIRRLKDFLLHIIGFHRIVKHFLQRVSVYDFKWYTDIGVGNAAYSAQLAGVVWSLKGSIIGLVAHYMKMKQMPKLNVQPRFQEVVSYTSFSCMLSFRIGHAIIAGLMLIKHWKKIPK